MQHINFMTDRDGYCIVLLGRLMCTSRNSTALIFKLDVLQWGIGWGVVLLCVSLCPCGVLMRGAFVLQPVVNETQSTSSVSHNPSVKTLLLKDCAAPSFLPSFSFHFLSSSFVSALPSFPPPFLVFCLPIFISSIIMFFFISLPTTDYRGK